MKELNFTYALILLLLCMACKTNKTQTETVANDSSEITSTPIASTIVERKEIIAVSRGACYGRCPIYNLTIYDNGEAEFEGKRFCSKLGPHLATLSDQQMALLKTEILSLNMDTYPEVYESMIADLPSTKITCPSTNGTLKSVSWKEGAPSELDAMASYLDNFRTSLDWQVNSKAPLPKGVIANQMLVHLKKGVSTKELINEYQAYDLTAIKELSPGQGYWVFEFNSESISAYELLNLLNKSEKIHNVEFNRQVEERN